MPRHLLDSASSLPASFLSSYSATDVPRVLTINNVSAAGLLSLGWGVCGGSWQLEEVGAVQCSAVHSGVF